MRYRLTVCFSLMLSLMACSGGEEEMVTGSKQMIKAFAGELQTELKAGMKKGGPLQALTVCNTAAERIAKSHSKQLGGGITRTSLKTRNKNNNPDNWEAEILKSFDARKQAGEAIDEIDHAELVFIDRKIHFRYMKAIPTKPICLVCHGEQIAPDLSKRLDELYPYDMARNFKQGDIRGAFSVIRQLGKGLPAN